MLQKWHTGSTPQFCKVTSYRAYCTGNEYTDTQPYYTYKSGNTP